MENSFLLVPLIPALLNIHRYRRHHHTLDLWLVVLYPVEN